MRELEKLQKTNVYSEFPCRFPFATSFADARPPDDAFCIGQEAGFGTINGLRLGRLPGAPVGSRLPCRKPLSDGLIKVEWPEINAAWGHTLLLLHTIARKFAFTFDTCVVLARSVISC